MIKIKYILVFSLLGKRKFTHKSLQHGENIFQVLNLDFEMKICNIYAYLDSVSEITIGTSIISTTIINVPFQNNLFLLSGGSTLLLYKIEKELKYITKVAFDKEEDVILTCYDWSKFGLYFSCEKGGIFEVILKDEIIVLNKIIDTEPLINLLVIEENDERYFIAKTDYGDLIKYHFDIEKKEFLEKKTLNISPIIDFDIYQNKIPFTLNSMFLIGNKLKNVYNGIQTYSFLESEPNYKGLNGIWTVKKVPENHNDSKTSLTHMIILSFIGETHFLGIIDYSIEEISKNTNFIVDKTTIDFKCIDKNKYLQITENEVRIVEFQDDYQGEIKKQQKFNENITVSYISDFNFVLCFGKDKLIIYNFNFEEEKTIKNGTDVSSLCIYENIIAIGTYDNLVYLNDLKKDQNISKIQLDKFDQIISISHSILMTKYHNNYYIFIGTRDGMLIIINLNNNQKIERRLGNHPLKLIERKSFGQIFAISDQTWMIQWNKFKESFETTYLNLKRSNFVYPFSFEGDENSVVSIINDEIHLSSLNTSIETFVKEIPITGHRVLAREKENDLLILNEKKMYVYHIDTSKLTDLYQFKSKPISIIQYKDYIVVGTFDGELLVFSIIIELSKYTIKVVSEYELYGIIYCLSIFNELIVCSASERLCIFGFKDKKLDLLTHNVCVYFIYGISCSKNKICISDKYDSSIFYYFDEKKNILDIIDGEIFTKCCGKILMIDDDFLLGVDRLNNFYGISVQKDIKNCVNFNLGETSLCLKKFDKNPNYKMGSLSILTDEKMLKQNHIDLDNRHSFIIGCVSGSLIQFTSITKREFSILNILENILEKSDENINTSFVGITHSEYRKSLNVIDGEYLMNFFYSNKQKEIIYELNEKLKEMVSLDEVIYLLNKF